MIGTLLIGLLVAVAVILAARSLWRNRKSACSCGGCAACSGCTHGRAPNTSGTAGPPTE